MGSDRETRDPDFLARHGITVEEAEANAAKHTPAGYVLMFNVSDNDEGREEMIGHFGQSTPSGNDLIAGLRSHWGSFNILVEPNAYDIYGKVQPNMRAVYRRIGAEPVMKLGEVTKDDA